MAVNNVFRKCGHPRDEANTIHAERHFTNHHATVVTYMTALCRICRDSRKARYRAETALAKKQCVHCGHLANAHDPEDNFLCYAGECECVGLEVAA